MVFLLAAVLGAFFLWSRGSEDSGYKSYSKHYVMITEDSDSWDPVYESALKEAESRDAYLERFGSNLAVKYERNVLLNLAIQASVDGIIVSGDEEEETAELINEAVDRGIPVVTVLRDSTGSKRQCFVSINSYNVGQEYGRQILELVTEETRRVMFLADENLVNTSQNLILLGIRETLEKELGTDHRVSVETAVVENMRNFSAEESIRDIFLDSENLPDILVCLNEVHTRCACQAAVDYNKVGEVQIIGYDDSNIILDAVAKSIIYSTISLDKEQMGRFCIQALDEYVETGHTNGYMAVDTHLLTTEDAAKMTEE